MKTIYFTPQPDITAYELAVIVGHLAGSMPPIGGIYCPDDAWESMGALQRHWSLTKPEAQ